MAKGCGALVLFLGGITILLTMLGVDGMTSFYIACSSLVIFFIIVWMSQPSKKQIQEKIERETKEKEKEAKEKEIEKEKEIQRKKIDRERIEKRWAIEDKNFFQKVKHIADLHKVSLGRERIRLIYQDAYGVDKDEKWEKDGIGYFINNVLLDQLDGHEKRLLAVLNARVYSIIDDVACEAQYDMNVSLNFDDSMSGVEFEKFCQDILITNGWDVTITKKSCDQGVDLIASQDSVTAAIQCKKSQATIGNKAVQEVVSGAKHYLIKHPIVVTNSTYTSSAKTLAKTNGVLLLHFSELDELLEKLTT